MKIIFSVSFFLFVTSLHAANCRFFKDQFIGSYKVLRYECESGQEDEDFECYAETDSNISVASVQISTVPMGIGKALAVKKMDSASNLVGELFFSELNLRPNQTFSCDERYENGVSVKIIKDELLGRTGGRIYSMLTKTNSTLELEVFSSFGGATSKRVFILESKN